jgi:hypothetical protein
MTTPSSERTSGVPAGGLGRGGNQGISIEGLNKYYTRWSNKEYRVLQLLAAVRILGNGRGLDLVIVDGEKKPIHKWRFESLRPSDLEKIVEKNPNAEGVGVVPGVLIYDPFHRLAILDIDDLELGTKHLETVFGKDWRERLLGGKDAFVILTGPRPKGEWECDCQSPGVDCKCVNKKTGETKALSELPRGLAVGVRIPNECAPMRCIRGEGIEVRAGSCYEVVYGRHPSGAFYQPARWVGDRFVNIELHELGGGAFVFCEEYEKLVEAIKGEVVGFTEEEQKEWEEVDRIISGPDKKTQTSQAQETQATQAQQPQATQPVSAQTPKSVKYRRLTEEQKQRVVEALKPHYKQGVRQDLWLALGGWGAWHHIHPVDIADVLLRLYKEAGDTDDLRMRGATIVYSYAKRSLPVDKQELAQVLGVEPYGPETVPEEKVSWRKLLKEKLGSDAEGVIKALRSVVGRGLLIRVPVTRKTTLEGGKLRWVISDYIINTPSGVMFRRKYKYIIYKDDNPIEQVNVVEEKLLDWSFMRLETYYDKYFDITYANAVVRKPSGIVKEYSMIKLDKLKRELEEEGLVRSTPRWDVILYSTKPRVVDIITSGLVCPPPDMGLPCSVRDYFNIGLAGPADKDNARETIEKLINIAYKYHPEPEAFLRGFVYGAFTNFTLTWKLHGLKPKLVALIGAWDSGKTTIGILEGWAFSPNIDNILATSVLLSPARVGRGIELLTNAVVTTPVVFDEAGTNTERGITRLEGPAANVLKNYVTQKYTWVTATGEKIPATSGVIITANQLAITDPALEEKIAFVSFTQSIPEPAQKAGARELRELAGKLIHFGRYYLQYAVDNWQTIKDVVLGANWEESAIQYFNKVLQSLGLAPLSIQPEERPMPSHLYLLRSLLQAYVRQYQALCKDESTKTAMDFFTCIDYLVYKDYIPFMKEYGSDYYRLTRDLERELGISVKVLCTELGGEYVTNTRNPRYYGSCKVDKKALQDALGMTIPQSSEGEEGTGEAREETSEAGHV